MTIMIIMIVIKLILTLIAMMLRKTLQNYMCVGGA